MVHVKGNMGWGGGGEVTGRGVEDSENLLIAFIKAHLQFHPSDTITCVHTAHT